MKTGNNGRNADVVVEFENTVVLPEVAWRDTVHLCSSFGQKWRIDNIMFSQKFGHATDLKNSLRRFIEYAEKQESENK